MLARPSELARRVIGCAIDVHRGLGPGLLESSYEAGLVYEFTQRDIGPALKRLTTKITKVTKC